jgi:hypothetical protein
MPARRTLYPIYVAIPLARGCSQEVEGDWSRNISSTSSSTVDEREDRTITVRKHQGCHRLSPILFPVPFEWPPPLILIPSLRPQPHLEPSRLRPTITDRVNSDLQTKTARSKSRAPRSDTNIIPSPRMTTNQGYYCRPGAQLVLDAGTRARKESMKTSDHNAASIVVPLVVAIDAFLICK